ncbi:MAG TPA: hypothetical protein VIC34_10685 [Croceibacterium sp.]|jgi:FtsH-binding integral membrane protein
MATVADIGLQAPPPRTSGGVIEFIDRWIWVFTAALIIATVLAGFVPDSIMKVGLVEAGKRPPFPPVLHVHAALMASWLLLLLTQTTLMATGRRVLHMQVGVAATVLAPAIVVTGLVLVPTMYHAAWAAGHAADPGLAPNAVPAKMAFQTNIALNQIRAGLLFPICVAIGLLARRTDAGLHKRMMILATVLPLGAAISRITWLPTTSPQSGLTIDLFPLLVVAPMFAWDLYHLRRVHRAYLIWLALLLPCIALDYLLWNSPWWFATVPRLMGVA